jgi:CRP-like cAMP-binding protein/cytochrome c-type biogenesis protein CcmH/NrfG
MSKRPIPADDVQDLVAVARRLSERELYSEAAEIYLLALRLDPKNVAVKLGLAEARKCQRQLRGGASAKTLRDVLREQLRRAAIDASHFLGLAHIYASKGENARALECLEVAKERDPENPAHYQLHGQILYRRKEYDGAAREFAKALHLNPFDRETASLLGQAHHELKHYEEALRASVHAFLLLPEADRAGAERLRRRIRTLKQLLGWGRREIASVFHDRQEHLHTAFDRLEWHRERFREEEGLGADVPTTASPLAEAALTGRIDLAARLRKLPILSSLTDEQVFRLTRAVSIENHEAGSVLFEHRTPGRDLYVLEEGKIVIQRPTHYGLFTLGTIPVGELFGEVNFLSLLERSADAVAGTSCRLLRFDADELDRLIETDSELAVQLYWTFWRSLAKKLRATNEQLKSFFASESQSENFLALRHAHPTVTDRVKVEQSDKIRLFREQGLSRSELMTLAAFSKEKRFAAGASIFQEGDEGTEMYVIVDGRARISKFIPGAGEEALAILERGEFFGEMSLIDGQPRSADARAHSGPLTCLALDQGTVREVLEMDPRASLEFLQLLCRLITHRLREIDEKVIGWRILAGEPGETRTA